MTTATWSSGNIHDSDANFRIWGKELSDKLQAMSGLTKTSDTGQINWTTVTRAGVAADAGYEIYYLNDSLHATAPIYFKLYYGTHTVASYPRLRLEVGTGSNGSGTLTGIGSGIVNIITMPQAPSATAQPSYLCVTTGFIGLGFKESAESFFAIARTVDSDGIPTTKGAFYVLRGSVTAGTMASRSLRFESTAAAYPSGAVTTAVGPCHVPSPEALATKQNGDDLAFMAWGIFPEMQPIPFLLAVDSVKFSQGATFTTTPMGTTARTYAKMVVATTNYPVNSNASYELAILWE